MGKHMLCTCSSGVWRTAWQVCFIQNVFSCSQVSMRLDRLLQKSLFCLNSHYRVYLFIFFHFHLLLSLTGWWLFKLKSSRKRALVNIEICLVASAWLTIQTPGWCILPSLHAPLILINSFTFEKEAFFGILPFNLGHLQPICQGIY